MSISRYNTFPGKVGVESRCISAVMSCLFVETFATLLADFVAICRPQRHPGLCPELHLLSFLLLSSVCFISRCAEKHTGTVTHFIMPNLFILHPVCCISCCHLHNIPTEDTHTTWSCSSRPVLTCCAYSCTPEGALLRFTLIQPPNATALTECTVWRSNCVRHEDVAEHVWYRYLLGLLAPVTGDLSTCVQEPLVIGRRGEI